MLFADLWSQMVQKANACIIISSVSQFLLPFWPKIFQVSTSTLGCFAKCIV